MLAKLANMAISANMAILANCCQITKFMSRNAHNNKIGKITKYCRQFDDFYNFGKYGDCGEFLSNHQMYVNQFHTWCPAMLANMAILANSCQITKFM